MKRQISKTQTYKTERKLKDLAKEQVENELHRLNRALTMLSKCSQLLVHESNEQELLDNICCIVVEAGGYRMAWVGYAQQDESKTVQPVAQFGFEEGYLDTVNITWADAERGRGPTGTAIRSRQIVIARNIAEDPNYQAWRVAAIQRRYVSSIALPLVSGDTVLGALNIYSAEINVFLPEEVNLLAELATDLAYGITALRTREDRKLAEELAQKSQQLLQDITDNSTAIIYATDLQGRVTLINRRLEAVFGMPRETLLGKNREALMPPEIAATHRDIDLKVINTRQAITLEEEYIELDGKHTYLSLKFPLLDSQGCLQGVGGISTDITERKRAEEKLQHSEHNLAEAERIGNTGSWEYDVALDTAAWSDNMFRIFDVDPAMPKELVFKHFVENLVHPDDRANILSVFQDALAGKRPYDLEYRTIKKDGSIIYIHAIAATHRDKDGNAIRMIGKVEDITKGKRAEEALRESEERYRLVHENSMDAILLTAPDGRILTANAAACKMFQRTEKEICQIGRYGLVDVNDPRLTILLEERAHTGKARGELTMLRKDGSGFPVELSTSVFVDRNGDKRTSMIIRDITQRKQAEEAIRNSHEQLRWISSRLAEVQETERQGLSKTLHDRVGQSLTALGINLKIIRNHLDRKTQQELSARFDSAQELVNEVTDHIRAVMAELHPLVLDDYGLGAALRWHAERFSKQTGLQIEVIADAIEPRLPPVTDIALFRIAQEALTNVVKHAHVTKAIVTLESLSDSVMMTISDTGVGFNLSIPTENGEMHWGVSTMRERAAAVGCDLQIISSPGMGAKIVIKVPR